MGFYGDWAIEEAAAVGVKYRVRCITNNGYGHCLTIGKEYEIELTPRILPMSPLCSFMGDDGKKGECHLERFEKVKSVIEER